MAMAQKLKEAEITEEDSLKEAEITEQDSLLLTRNLLRIAIFNISYIRGLFPETYFNDKSVPALDMEIKNLLPIDPKSRRLIDWMEKGVYDALQKKYLKTLMFCICESVEGPMIEEYSFNFSYSDSDSQDVNMDISRTGTKKHGGTLNFTADISQNQMSSACKMVRTLVQFMRTLDKMPDKRTIVMKLMYYDDVTPPDYEPPFFRVCTVEEAQHVWTKNPLRKEVGNVNSKHIVLTLKVKSVLDPCADENNDMQDDGKTTGPNSVHDDQLSESDSEISQTKESRFRLAPVEKQDDDDGEVDEDNTQDPVESQQQLERVKDWIDSRHLDTLKLTEVLSNFTAISIAPGSEFNFVKDEADGKTAPEEEESIPPEYYMCMKKFFHSLPMQQVTVTKLHNMLDGGANHTAVRKLIDQLIRDGYLEDSYNGRKGKLAIQSDLTKKRQVHEFLTAPLFVVWDGENCPIPREMADAGIIPSRILEKFKELNYTGEIEIILVVSHIETFTPEAVEALKKQGVKIAHFDTRGVKDLAEFIAIDMITGDLLERVPVPASLFVISGDFRFVDVLQECEKCGYNVMAAWMKGIGARGLVPFSYPCLWENFTV